MKILQYCSFVMNEFFFCHIWIFPKSKFYHQIMTLCYRKRERSNNVCYKIVPFLEMHISVENKSVFVTTTIFVWKYVIMAFHKIWNYGVLKVLLKDRFSYLTILKYISSVINHNTIIIIRMLPAFTREKRASYHCALYCLSILSMFFCSDLEPEWLDDIQKNGELFYLELSESEEEAALSQANQCVSTNHVRFSEKEAEIITEQNNKKPCSSRVKGVPPLKRLARILRRKHRASQHRGGKDASKNKSASSPPASILKNQPGQRQGVTVQQQQLKEVCVYLNPKRLAGSSTPLSDSGGLLEALVGVIHRPAWRPGQGVRQEERLTVHGLIPNSPAIKCGQILIGKTINLIVKCYQLIKEMSF